MKSIVNNLEVGRFEVTDITKKLDAFRNELRRYAASFGDGRSYSIADIGGGKVKITRVK